MNPLSLLGGISAPYQLIGGAMIVGAVVLGLIGYGDSRGFKRATDAANTEKLEAVRLAIEKAQLIAKEDAAIAAASVQKTESIRTITRTIRIKESAHAKANPLPADCVLDATRLRNANAALAGRSPDAAAQPDYALPASATVGK